jgi:hypothetical protein
MMLPGKRKYYRLDIESPLAFKIIRGENPKETSPLLEGMLKNISVGGLNFGTDLLHYGGLHIFNESEINEDLEFKPNSLLLKFRLPGKEKPLTFHCQPRWYAQGGLGDSFDYHIGAKYLRGAKEDILLIRDYIQKHGDKKELSRYAQNTKEVATGEAAERRAERRELSTLRLRYKIISPQSGKSPTMEAVGRDIAVGGICARVKSMSIDGINMTFDKNPTSQNRIFLEIFIPGHSKPLTAIGEVRWFERSTVNDAYNYDVGIEFTKISQNNRKIIANHVKNKQTESAKT